MSVTDEKIIDFAGLDKNGKRLILTITDYLTWGEETDDVHLLMLQNKLNVYLQYIESGEVNEEFEPDKYNYIVISIIAKYPFSAECLKFLSMSKKAINEAGFGLEWEFMPSCY